jgi:hypothetical protein
MMSNEQIVLNQALIMRALAMLLVPGDQRAVATFRGKTAEELFSLADDIELLKGKVG